MNDWWKGSAIYQIYPRSFFDSNNDGVGDLGGIVAKLDYVASLGVDGIWISPFFTSPMADHGYDIADYRDVDPVFGTLEDFDVLVAKAHRLGLKVIIDQVYSHTSENHAWFEESRQSRDNPKSDWYVWADPKPDGSAPNNWQSVFGGISWEWESRRRQYYLHNFAKQQPDLNYHCEALQEEILDTARFWLERGVDGFRLDAVNLLYHHKDLLDNPPSRPGDMAFLGTEGPQRPYFYQAHDHDHTQPETIAFLERLRKVTDSYGARFMVGELGAPFETCVDYTKGEGRLHTCYSFPLLVCSELNAELVREFVQPWNGVDAWPSWAFSNHDVTRALSRFSQEGNETFAKLLNALLLCLRGTVFMYQGEELGLVQAHVPMESIEDPLALNTDSPGASRDGCRTPMPWSKGAANSGFSQAKPWLPVDPRHDATAVDQQDGDPASILNFTRRLLRLRKQHPALKAGSLKFIDAPVGLLLFVREHEGERLICGFNLTSGALAYELEASSDLLELDLGTSLSDGVVRVLPFGAFIAQ
ncbi:MAG: alpha-amylase family glycosyl hydrolase [Pseudomonadota bacterium]